MSKDILEKKLDILIKLVENLPESFLKAFEKNKEIQKQIRLKECQDDIEFCHHNIRAINKMMFGVDLPPVKIEADNPEDQHTADQLAKVYNHIYVGNEEKNG